jgi:hypothetical protein
MSPLRTDVYRLINSRPPVLSWLLRKTDVTSAVCAFASKWPAILEVHSRRLIAGRRIQACSCRFTTATFRLAQYRWA